MESKLSSVDSESSSKCLSPQSDSPPQSNLSLDCLQIRKRHSFEDIERSDSAESLKKSDSVESLVISESPNATPPKGGLRFPEDTSRKANRAMIKKKNYAAEKLASEIWKQALVLAVQEAQTKALIIPKDMASRFSQKV